MKEMPTIPIKQKNTCPFYNIPLIINKILKILTLKIILILIIKENFFIFHFVYKIFLS